MLRYGSYCDLSIKIALYNKPSSSNSFSTVEINRNNKTNHIAIKSFLTSFPLKILCDEFCSHVSKKQLDLANTQRLMFAFCTTHSYFPEVSGQTLRLFSSCQYDISVNCWINISVGRSLLMHIVNDGVETLDVVQLGRFLNSRRWCQCQYQGKEDAD